MSKSALFIRHRSLPGKRDEVRRIWEKHLPARVASNPAHEAYYYCYDAKDPDRVCVFQLYSDSTSAQDFVKGDWYPAYEQEVAPYLSGESEFRVATPMWMKDAT